MKIRFFQNSDLTRLTELFYETIHKINNQNYSQEQLDAWASEKRDQQDWEESFKNKWAFFA